ncbi:MAG: histidine kinase [Bacteroidota bacterium]
MRFFGYIVLLLLATNSFGQGVTFKNINTSDGLSSNLVYSALQGPDDMLWILANNSLDSYTDGKVTNYTNDIIAGIENYNVSEIMIDSSNLIWLRSSKRELLYLDENRKLHHVDMEDVAPSGILNLIKGKDGKVQLLAKEGHFCYRLDRQKVDTIHLFDAPIYLSPALQITRESKERYLITSRGKAILYNGKSGNVEYVFDQVVSHGAALIDDVYMLISTFNHHELFLVNMEENQIEKNLALDFLEKQPGINTYYRRIRRLDENHIGITSGYQGLFILNTDDFSFENYAHDFADPGSISSDNAYRLFTGNDGNVFVTSRTSGLNIFNRFRRNAKYIGSFIDEDQNTIFEGHISHVAKDSKGYYWLASAQGLLKYSDDTHTIRSDVRAQEEGEILGLLNLFIDQWDRIFLCLSGGGLEILDTKGNEIKSFRFQEDFNPSLKSNFVYTLIIGSDEKLWVGTSKGINVLDLNTLMLDPNHAVDSFEELETAIRELRVIDGETFIGTWREGAYVLSEDTLQTLDFPEVHNVSNVTDFGKDNLGRLYVGSQSGLFVFNHDDEMNSYEFDKKILDGRILSIDKDREGNLWIAIENALYKFNQKGEKIEAFTEENRFMGGGFRMHASYVDTDGIFHYGLNTGMCYFDPAKLTNSNLELNPFITGVIQNENQILISGDQTINLTSSKNNVGVYYQNIDLWNTPELSYQYSVTIQQDNWVEAITNPILIQNLNSGLYEVKLRATENGKDWVEASNSIAIQVDYPWWRTWWFYGLVLVVLLTLTYALLKFYRRLKADQSEKKKYDESLRFFSFSMHKYADMEKEFWNLILECIGQLDIDACAIYTLEKNDQEFVRQAVRVASPDSNEFLERLSFVATDNNVLGTAVTKGLPVVIDDLDEDQSNNKSSENHHSKICVPIISNDEVLGVIDCEHRLKNYFNDRRLSFLSAISTIVATKIIAYQAEEERKEAEISLSNNLKKVSELEMKSLRSQMNPHFMFNSLNSINNFIVKNDQENASDYLTSFAQLMRIILENSRQDWVSLESELRALRLYIGMEKLRFENLFYFHESIDDEINMITTLIPPMLIQPYIENAIWHGLLPKRTEQCNLSLILKKEEDYLKIVIEDDGIGTKNSKKRKSSFNVTKKSFGQKIISERLDMINKIYDLNAHVEVKDKSELPEPESGTIVTLSMKIKTLAL